MARRNQEVEIWNLNASDTRSIIRTVYNVLNFFSANFLHCVCLSAKTLEKKPSISFGKLKGASEYRDGPKSGPQVAIIFQAS